jgi:glycosyltransferase involved in cell wall biosynthesis
LKIALVHDWLSVDAGAEKCLKEFNSLYSNASVYSIVDFLSDRDRESILNSKKTKNTFIQKLPFAKKYFRKYLPFFPMAIESLNLKGYDVVLSDSYAFAKGVLPVDNQLHICYCHTPMRFIWDLYFDYLADYGVQNSIFSPLIKQQLHKLRTWDIISSNRVDFFIANSKYVQKRIKRIYRRDSIVIYPPVDTEFFDYYEKKEDFYLVVSRLVPYKKSDLVVKAFNQLGKKLVVIGAGDGFEEIERIAEDNISLLGYQSRETIRDYMQRAKGFVFAGLEDFGIVMAEAQSCGTPVICLDRGGSSEIVVDGISGVYFSKQNEENIVDAVKRFESISFDYKAISINAKRFSAKRFRDEIENFVKESYFESKS